MIQTTLKWLTGLSSLGLIIGLGLPLMTSQVWASPSRQDCGEGVEGFRTTAGLESDWPNTDFCKHIYQSTNGFRSGGVGRDQIPPIYPADYVYPDAIKNYGGQAPAFTVSYESVTSAQDWLVDQHPVLAVELNGEARAYPLGILTRHEIANTEIGGIPVAVTFCPLCNTGIVFERRLDGRELHFGVSGLLRFSDMIMWDHETESWWQQGTGEGLVGEYAGAQLTYVVSSMVSFADFRTQYPDGEVLSAQGRGYNYNPYQGYDSSTSPFLFDGYIDERLPATSRILGFRTVTDDGTKISTAYPFATLEENIVANDVVNGVPLVAFWQPGAVSALDAGAIDDSKAIGSATLFEATLEDGTLLTFHAEGTTIRDDQTGSTWNLFGQATEGELAGTQLQQKLGITHFWFAWQAFESFTVIWEPGTTTDALLAAE